MNHIYNALHNQLYKVYQGIKYTSRTLIAASLIGAGVGLIGLMNTPSELELRHQAQKEMRAPGEVVEVKYKTPEDIKNAQKKHINTYSWVTAVSIGALLTSALVARKFK